MGNGLGKNDCIFALELRHRRFYINYQSQGTFFWKKRWRRV